MTIQETLDQLVAQNLGKPVEREDPSNLDQCFDWLFAYVDALGIPRSAVRHLKAYEIWTDATDETRKYFDLIANTATAIPQKGDIPIFGTAVGPSGHVCLATGEGDVFRFKSTDQNWNKHLYIEYIVHDYGPQTGEQRGVLGWLRPKNQGGGTVEDNIKRKSGFFDQIWLHRFGPQTNTDQATQQQVTDFNSWLDSNVHRAGAFDQICLALGLVGDSNQITVNQVLAKITDPTATKKLAQIKTIVNA